MLSKLIFACILIAILHGQVNLLFLEPSIYGNPPATKLICQNSNTDLAAAPTSLNHESYLKCANQGKLKIQKAELVISTQAQCPLQYTGIDKYNQQNQCLSPYHLFMTDATTVVKALCNGKVECVFSWNQLPELVCSDGKIEKVKNLSRRRLIKRIKRYVNQQASNKYLFGKVGSEYGNDDLENDIDSDDDDYENDDYEDEEGVVESNVKKIKMLKSKKEKSNEDKEPVTILVLRSIAKNDQALNVTFTCNTPRGKFRPFSNKRYNAKFSPSLQHPFRKLSLNRLNQL